MGYNGLCLDKLGKLQSQSETSVFLRIHSSWVETREKPDGFPGVHNEWLCRPKEITPIKVILPPMTLVARPCFTKVKQFFI